MASILKVDKLDPQSGTTLELGTSGDTVNLGSGVTAGTGLGGDLSFGGDTFGADKTVGANDAYAFTLETSGNPAIKMDALGHVTKPLQPAFLASCPNETLTNLDTAPTMRFNNEIIDINADYNPATFTFTAPVTGSYHFNWSVGISGMSAENNDWYIKLYTSNFSVRTPDGLFQRAKSQDNVNQYSASAIVDMDASDVAYVVINSYDDATLETYPERSWFSGFLMG